MGVNLMENFNFRLAEDEGTAGAGAHHSICGTSSASLVGTSTDAIQNPQVLQDRGHRFCGGDTSCVVLGLDLELDAFQEASHSCVLRYSLVLRVYDPNFFGAVQLMRCMRAIGSGKKDVGNASTNGILLHQPPSTSQNILFVISLVK
jgi:hypothetical protein